MCQTYNENKAKWAMLQCSMLILDKKNENNDNTQDI